ncbi:MAG: tetratricopeptide repeat protein, partial [Alphaproteobacteria bacterium]
MNPVVHTPDLAPAAEARAPSDSPRLLLSAVSALLVGLSLAGCKQPAPTAARLTTVAVASASAPAPAFGQAISPFGSYLAARHAESVGDLGSAAEFMAEVVASGTAGTALLRQSFAFMTSVGRLDDAANLAERLIAEGDKSPAPAVLLALEKALAGNYAAAAAGLEPLPRDGVGKLLMPLLLAWARMGMGETDSALGTLAALGEARSLSPVILLHAALISDLAGRRDHARVNFEAAAEAAEKSSFRVIEAMASFLIRTGDKEKARALVRRFEEEFPGSDILRPTAERIESGATVEPLVRSAREGMAEALFAVAAGLLRQGDDNMALAYSHMALRLNPDLQVGLLLVAEIQEKLGRNADAIESYKRLDADLTFGWESRLRVATNLSELGRADEAIAQLEAMSLERPERHDALYRLGDVLRNQQRYAQAVVAY